MPLHQDFLPPQDDFDDFDDDENNEPRWTSRLYAAPPEILDRLDESEWELPERGIFQRVKNLFFRS